MAWLRRNLWWLAAVAVLAFAGDDLARVPAGAVSAQLEAGI